MKIDWKSLATTLGIMAVGMASNVLANSKKKQENAVFKQEILKECEEIISKKKS